MCEDVSVDKPDVKKKKKKSSLRYTAIIAIIEANPNLIISL